MNNNQNNFNNSNQTNNQENPILNNLSSGQPLNVIPPMNPVNSNQNNDSHQFDAAFINNTSNNNVGANLNQNTYIDNQVVIPQNNEQNEINQVIKTSENRFINNNIDTTGNSLNDLNIESEYSNTPKVDYSKEPQVVENLKKRNTVTITSEGKVFIIIIIALLLFIFVLPTIFEFVRDIMYQ